MTHARRQALALAAAFGVLLTLGGGARWKPRLLVNTTASAPLGFYALSPGRFARGDLAAVYPPPSLAHWLAVRRYLPANVPLLKVVAATEGQTVCGRGHKVLIDGRVVAWRQPRDHWGRALPAFRECRRLRLGEVFLLNADAPASLDSRYFGPVPAHGVLGRARPIWTWEAQR